MCLCRTINSGIWGGISKDLLFVGYLQCKALSFLKLHGSQGLKLQEALNFFWDHALNNIESL